MLVPPGERSKLSACTRTGIYLGPAASGVSTHRVLVQGRVIVTREVVFSQEAREALLTSTEPARPAIAPSPAAPTVNVPLVQREQAQDAPAQEGDGQPREVTVDLSGPPVPSSLGASGGEAQSPPRSPHVDVSNIEHAAQDHLSDHDEHPDLLTPPNSPVLGVETDEDDAEDAEAAPPSLQASGAATTATKNKWPTPKKPPARERKKNPKYYGDDFHAFTAKVLHVLNVNDDA